MSKVQVDRRVGTGGPSNDRLIDAIAEEPRRAVLRAVRARSEPVSVAELVAHVRATTGGPTPDGSERPDLATALRHVHLPALSAAGLVEWDETAGVVAGVDDRDAWLDGLLGVETDDWDEVLDALRPRRGRIALGELATAGDLDRADLARRVAAAEAGVAPTEVPESDRRSAAVALRHVHLPALADAGLIDRDGETIRYVGHPDLDAERLPY